MSLEAAVTFFLAIFVFGITPGPGVFAILARSMTQGPRACLSLALGMTMSDLVYLLLACFGLAAIAEHWEALFLAIRYIGSAYLIYLGYKMFRAVVSSESTLDEAELKAPTRAFGAGWLQGFLISASNPKVILFYISFLPTFIDLSVLSGRDLVLISVLSSLALMMGLMLIALMASRMARLFKTPRAQKRLNQGSGSIMIAAGAYLALNR